MIKVVTLLTRKPGMSREAFIEHYETHHRKIGEKYLGGFAVKYQRRYLQSAGFREQEGDAPPFDVLMEIWYPDEDALNGAMAVLSTEEAQVEIESHLVRYEGELDEGGARLRGTWRILCGDEGEGEGDDGDLDDDASGAFELLRQ